MEVFNNQHLAAIPTGLGLTARANRNARCPACRSGRDGRRGLASDRERLCLL